MFKKKLILFTAICFFLIILEFMITSMSLFFTRSILIYGTIFLTLVHILTLYISYQAGKKKSAHQFVTGVTASTLVKLFLCVAGAGIYIYLHRTNLNKADLFFLMGIYIVFSIIEAIIAGKHAKLNA